MLASRGHYLTMCMLVVPRMVRAVCGYHIVAVLQLTELSGLCG